jgi:3-methyladenine DNA glycosylase/8-oxoguanine DNA glycosylase
MQITLSATPPFSLPSVIRSHGWIQLAPFHEDEITGDFSCIVHLESEKVIELRVQSGSGGIIVNINDALPAAEVQAVREIISWMLDLDRDFSTFYNLASQEPKLAQAVTRARGRILRSPTLFEDVVKTILTTNTLWAATIRMNKNLVQQFGSPLPADTTRHAFPTPGQLAAVNEETLRLQTRLGYRAPYILQLARSVDSGEFDLESLKKANLPTSELRKKLLTIKGIGDYAAANLLMLLGHYDFIPVDSWALKMVSNEWYAGAPVGRAEVEAAFERWGQWQGLAYWLWDWSG